MFCLKKHSAALRYRNLFKPYLHNYHVYCSTQLDGFEEYAVFDTHFMSEPLQGKMIIAYSPCKEAGSNSFLTLKANPRTKFIGPIYIFLMQKLFLPLRKCVL